MTVFESMIAELSAFIWGPVMLVLLVGVGIYLTIGLKAMPWRKTPLALKQLSRTRDTQQTGDITPFQALMTALSATVGTGNIAGVATAIVLGGPGAVFWMWITALFGMATKYAEAVLAVKYREVDTQGNHVGGPMYYIRNGLGKSWAWLAVLFALFGTLASFGIGNMVQANSVADALGVLLNIPDWAIGLSMALLTAIVILGGIHRIAEVAAFLVPIMAIAYLAGSLWVLIDNYQHIPAAFALIFTSAFTGSAAAGGFAGATVWAALRFGVARGIFSNEAGLGSAPIAHAAAKTDNPVQQGMVAMLGTCIDTLVLCTLTALVILVSGVWQNGADGAELSTLAFATALPGFGGYIVACGLAVFAFTTILGWSYYGERCAAYLFGTKITIPYRLLWIVAIPLGATGNLKMIWSIADVMNGLMAVPNLVALILLSPVVFKLTRQTMQQEQ